MLQTNDIVFEDNSIVCLNKPAGILSIPDRYNPNLPNAQTFLQKLYGQIFTVHRLDKETTGILCFAKTEAAHRHLSLQFNQHSVTKIYHCLLQGSLLTPEGTIDLPIGENPLRAGTMRIDRQHGKPSMTHYKVLERFRHYTYTEAQILTGRMHQIRVHFKALGFPLMVDAIYGKQQKFLLSSIKPKYHLQKNAENELPLLQRVPLHAHTLVLTHPETDTPIHLSADLPKDLCATLNQLRKHDAL